MEIISPDFLIGIRIRRRVTHPNTHFTVAREERGQDCAEERRRAESQETGVSSLCSTTILLHDLSFYISKMKMGLGSCQLKCPTHQTTGLPGFSEPTELKPCWSRALCGRWGGPSQKLSFPFHCWLEVPSIKVQRVNRLSFPSHLHVWLSLKAGMTYTQRALGSSGRDSELWIQNLGMLLSSLALAWLSTCCWHAQQEN